MFVLGARARACRSLPFALLGGAWPSSATPFRGGRRPRGEAEKRARKAAASAPRPTRRKDSVKEQLKTAEIELVLGKQLSIHAAGARTTSSAHRVGKMRRKFATQYGFVVPEIKLTDDLVDRRRRATRSRSTARVVADQELRIGEVLVRHRRRTAGPTCPATKCASPLSA